MYELHYFVGRYLGTLKKSVKNKARPEGSIAETHISKEALTFCSMYLNRIDTKFNQKERNDDARPSTRKAKLSIFSQAARPFGGRKQVQLPHSIINKMHWYILNNCEEIRPYLE